MFRHIQHNLAPCESLSYSHSTDTNAQPAEGRFWVQMTVVLAKSRGGAAMFTRSTPSCGTLDGPSLAWAASLWQKLRSSDGSPGLRLPSANGQLSRLASYLRMVYAQYIHGIYQEYTLYILSDSKSCLLSAIEWLSWNAMLVHGFKFIQHWLLLWKLAKLKDLWTWYMYGIYHAYTWYMSCIYQVFLICSFEGELYFP